MGGTRLARVVCVSVMAWMLAATPVWAISFNRYHSQDEIKQFLQQTATENPDLVRFAILGKSLRGRDIPYVVVTHGDPEGRPSIYVNGTHHGDEWSSTETALGVIDYLVIHEADPNIASLLDAYAIYIQPLVNPDGHAANTRTDSQGRDPNRDYSYPDRPDSDSFRIPEIRLVKALSERVSFRAAIAFHSGEEGVLWPWCWTGDRANDHDVFQTLSRNAARAMGMNMFLQSYYDYATNGEFIDYEYMTHNTLAVTFEVSADATPPSSRLAAVVNRAFAGSLNFMLAVQSLDRGTLVVERDEGGPRSIRLAEVVRLGGARFE